jgi:predicted regulator of Ras-like GTPase activity (Roadblock/LC7/MglB family)
VRHPRADDLTVTTGTPVSIRTAVAGLVERVVDGVPGVSGALIASADGFVIAARLSSTVRLDAAALAAMSAATLGLAGRLVGVAGRAPVDVVVQRSADAQVLVFSIGAAAALTVLAEATADTERITRIGSEMAAGLVHAFTQPA